MIGANKVNEIRGGVFYLNNIAAARRSVPRH